MRQLFFETLIEEMAQDSRICFVTGDMGFGLAEAIRDRFPRQYVNAGIAEQNMTGIAAGLALSGRTAFTYSIANFPTLRCLEQIRNDVCYHNANVKIVAVGGGYGYGALGVTHHAGEDLAIMRALPNMTVLAPGDLFEAEMATRAAIRHEGPVYLRLGRGGEPRLHPQGTAFALGRALWLRHGSDATLVATGSMLPTAAQAATRLEAEGLRVGVLSVPSLKPLDEVAIREAADRAPILVTIEEHSILGGLGGAVAEVLAEAGRERPLLFRRIGMPSAFPKLAGTHDVLKAQAGLEATQVARTVMSLYEASHKGGSA